MQALQQEIAQAEAKIAELREKLKQQQSQERNQAISSIKEMVKLHGLTSDDLGLDGKRGKSAKKTERANRADKGVPVAPKYIDPASGSKWTGRGRPPAWLAAHLAAGRSKDDYLISKSK